MKIERYENSIGSIIRFLTDVKSNLICDFHENHLVELGSCGALAAIGYLDDAIKKMLSMQTEIEEIRSKWEFEKQTVDEYESVFGQLDDWTDEEISSVQEIVKKHNEFYSPGVWERKNETD